MILLLLACSGPTWTASAVLEGARAHADLDHNGTITAKEMPGDADGDGIVTEAELRAFIEKQGAKWHAAGWDPPRRALVQPHDIGWEVVATVREEILSVDPNAQVPTLEAMEAVAHAPVTDPGVQALLREMEPAAAKANVVIPAAVHPPVAADQDGLKQE
jgi:hypothetical protein